MHTNYLNYYFIQWLFKNTGRDMGARFLSTLNLGDFASIPATVFSMGFQYKMIWVATEAVVAAMRHLF